MSRAPRRARALALAALLLVAPAGAAGAATPATVAVDDVRVRGDGRHELVVSVLDDDGAPLAELMGFQVTVDGVAVEDLRARPGRTARPRATVTLVADAALFGGPTLADLQGAVRDLAAALPPTDRLRVIAAGRGARAREADAGEGERLAAGLGELQDPEPPHLYDALASAARAASRLPASHGGVVLVVTRGSDGGSRRGAVEVLAFARGRARLTPVLGVLLGDRGGAPEAERLRRLAASAGGAFTEATSLYGLGPVLSGLAQRGLGAWKVDFRAPGWSREVPRHRLGVAVEQGGARRAAETEYETAEALAPPWWRAPQPWLLLGLALLAGAAAFVLTRRRQRGLLVHDGDEWDGVWYEVFGFPVTVGGAAGNDVVLGDPQVSRNHAVLERRGRAVELADLNSENGTFVNGERVSRRVLADGDRVSFGPAVHLIYEARG